MSMEYSAVVGTMVVDEVAHVNERMSRAIEELQDTSSTINGDYGHLEVCFNKEVRRRRSLERRMTEVENDHQSLRHEVSSLWGLVNNILFQLVDVESEVWELRLFWAVMQHGLMNLINVDGETVVDSEEGREEEEVEVVDDQPVFLTGGLLVPIEDEEDPCDAAREVEWAEERAELMCRWLMMDDEVFQEAMETEQRAHLDPVPGYHPAPEYSK